MPTQELVHARWRKSTRSGTQGGQCVEVAHNLPGIVAVRDSKAYRVGEPGSSLR